MTDNLGEAGPMTGDLRALAESFAEIGAQVGARDAGPTLQAIVDTAVERVVGTRWASITSLRGDTFSTVVSTGETARRADAIQYAVGSGPCLDAIVDDAIYRPRDLRLDARWPLRSSREIGMAVGVLMATPRVTREQAFDLLRLASQNSNRKLHDIAAEVVDTGALPSLQPRPSHSRG